MANQKTGTEFQQAWDMSEEDLYKQLGMSSLGTSNFTESIGSMHMLMSVATTTNAQLATKSLGENLLIKGKEFFFKSMGSDQRSRMHNLHRQNNT